MDELNALKQAACAAIDGNQALILGLAEQMAAHPELGYKEYTTAALVRDHLAGLGLPVREGIAVTGLRAEAKGRASEAKVALMAELDAVVCCDHPQADPLTGAAHACGHHLQHAVAFGALLGLVAGGAMPHLDGDVSYLGVPAEEPVDLEFRAGLREKGKIRFFAGKQEFLRLGEFDDLDAILMVHADSDPPEGRQALLTRSSNGFLIKRLRYVGREAHAGAFPHEGVNALNACMLGMMGIHAQRETFREEDTVRVHPIVTRGGDAVNVVPADVRLDMIIRAASVAALTDADKKVARALQAGADAVGAVLEAENAPGFLPLMADADLNRLFADNTAELGGGLVLDGYHMTASTDAGDVSQYRPTIQPMVGGVRGKIHTREFAIAEPQVAIFGPAKALAATVIDLLYHRAERARQIRTAFQPQFTREGFSRLWDQLCREGA